MARFRRRQRVEWFGVSQDGFQQTPFNWFNIETTFAPISPPLTEITASIPLLPDLPTGDVPSTISDMSIRGYRLRRIVGKLFLQNTTANEGTSGIVPVMVGIGFMVRQVNPTTGAAIASLNEQSVLRGENARDPWMWRRTWLLGSGDLNAGFAFFNTPANNAVRPSAFDGPHIDCKTNRKVQAEERVIMNFSVAALIGTGAAPNNASVRLLADLRMLTSPVQLYGNRGNASR